MNFLDTDAEDFIRFDACGVEEYHFNVLGLSHAVKLVDHAGNGGQICKIDTQYIDFDGRIGIGDERCILLLESLSIAGKEDDVVNAFGGKLGGDVVANAGTSSEYYESTRHVEVGSGTRVCVL